MSCVCAPIPVPRRTVTCWAAAKTMLVCCEGWHSASSNSSPSPPFQTYDTDSSGDIDENEFVNGMSSLGGKRGSDCRIDTVTPTVTYVTPRTTTVDGNWYALALCFCISLTLCASCNRLFYHGLRLHVPECRSKQKRRHRHGGVYRMGEAGRYPAKWVRQVSAEIAQLMMTSACSHSPHPCAVLLHPLP